MDDSNKKNDELVQQLGEATARILKGGTLRDEKGMTDDEVETIYALGYNLYSTGRADDAETVFDYLTLIDHTNAKFWIARGAVEQMKRQFEKAVTSYAFAGFLDLEDPKPQYHAAECYLALGDRERALSALAALDQYAPKDSPYRAKAKALEEKIKS